MFSRMSWMVLLTLAACIPLSAQIQYCYGYSSCQYLVNTGFDPAGAWVYTGTSARTYVTDACSSGSTWAARVGNGASVYQDFYAEPQGNFPHQWNYRFDVYFGSSGGTIYDQLKITVDDLDTGTSETKYIDATQYGTCGSVVTQSLSRDYRGHDVRITFVTAGLAAITIDVDNVAFFSSPAP